MNDGLISNAARVRPNGRLSSRLRAQVTQTRALASRQVMFSGESSANLHVLISGMAARYRMLGNGCRQITALILPGEICNLADRAGLGQAAHVVALTGCMVGEIPLAALFDERGPRSDWADFIFHSLSREWIIASEWIVSLGRRSAYEAAAHLFCELWVRLDAIGLTDGKSFAFGLTQVELSDVLGMTSIHVNRTLRALRENGLVKVRRRLVTILDHAALVRAADFNAAYLQLNSPEHRPSKGHAREKSARLDAPERLLVRLGSSSGR